MEGWGRVLFTSISKPDEGGRGSERPRVYAPDEEVDIIVQLYRFVQGKLVCLRLIRVIVRAIERKS